MKYLKYLVILFILCSLSCAQMAMAQDDDSSRQILKQGLLGAGTGAIAASASGGKAGEGALIGAGTSIIGSALLDAITAPPSSGRAQRRGYAPPPDDYYYADEPEEYYYEEPPQTSTSTNILKQGLVGAGTGAIAAGASGGKAGQGALIGAGTAVVGNALLDTLTQPAPQRRGRVYRKIPVQAQQRQNVQVQEEPAGAEGGRRKIIKKYDASGKLVSEEEIYY